MKSRADAVSEVEAAGSFEDLTALGPPQDDIDRQLDQLGRSSAVDDDLQRMKAEQRQGSSPVQEVPCETPTGEATP